MKLTAIFLLACCLQVSAIGFSQTVTYSGKNVQLEKVLTEVKKQTGYTVAANMRLLRNAPLVTVQASGQGLDAFLHSVLDGAGLQFTLINKTIFISPAPAPQPSSVPVQEAALQPEPPPPPITGRVLNPDRQPLQGATVLVKGSKKGVETNNNGLFTIEAQVGDVLVISYTGFKTKEVKLTTAAVGAIVLELSDNKLDEVQIIAYGKTSRRLSTGNSAGIKAEDIEKQPINNPLLSLQGRVPGISITQVSGMPGGGIDVKIQGRNSIRSGSDPLYIVDGIPLLSQLPQIEAGEANILGNSGTVAEGSRAAAGNPLSFINPLDIESIEVLKDADATAIYGSRAGNGAILITTKKGKEGRMQLNANIQNGWTWQPARIEVLNTREYLDMRYEAFKNGNIDWKATNVNADDLKVWDTTRYTNWQNELLGKVSQFRTISTTISGGDNGTTYLVGGTYANEGVPFPGDFGNKRISLNFNLGKISLNQKLRLKFSGNFQNNSSLLPGVTDITSKAMFLEPNAPNPFNNDGTINWQPNAAGVSTFTEIANPYINLLRTYKRTINNFFGNWSVGYQVLKNLEISNSMGFTYANTETISSTPTTTIAPENRSATPNSAIYGSRLLNSWIIEPQITYNTKLFAGNLNLLLGGTALANNSDIKTITGQSYSSDALLGNAGSAATTSVSSDGNQYKYAAIFYRMNYNLNDEYILNFTFRRDGTSRFGKNNQFHNFGAIGAAWIFTKSKFLISENSWLSFGKIRTSYGITGNDQIADFIFIPRYGNAAAQVPYQGGTGLKISGLPNPNLQWETTKKLSLGINLGAFNDKILLNIDYNINTSDNQLNPNFFLPRITGFAGYTNNFPGTVRNTNWEFTLSTQNLKRVNFEWSTNFNVTIARNKLVSFPELESSAYASTYRIGESLDMVLLSKFAGVNPLTGLYQFENKYGQLTDSPTYPDDLFSLSLNPSLYGGFENNFSLGDFNLSIFFQFTKQNGFEPILGRGIGSSATPGAFTRGTSNQPISILNRWRSVGDQAIIKKFSSQTNESNTLSAYGSNMGYTDASFARLKNVSFSWKISPKFIKQFGIQSARIFANGQNLLTITRYKGLNPERPVSVAALPPMRVFVMGANIGF